MAHLLFDWINSFGLSRLASDEADLANGFLFAELLARHNQLPEERAARGGAGSGLQMTAGASGPSSPTPSVRSPPRMTGPGPFRDTDRVEDAARNFAGLLPTLQRLGIKVSPTTVQDIVRGRAGCATRLAYDLYSRLAVLERVRVGRGTDDVPKPLVQAQVRVAGVESMSAPKQALLVL